MTADIRIACSLLGHPKRIKLSKLLGQDCTGYLLDLWIRVAALRPDGVLTDLDAEDIAILAGWTGDHTAFVEALLLCRWMDRRADGVLVLHDWAEHQPWVVGAAGRSQRAKMAANVRHHGRAEHHPEGRPEAAEQDAQRPGAAKPGVRKMPEVGSKNGNSCSEHAQRMPDACAKDAAGMPDACGEHAGRNAPLLSSSSTLQKDRKAPPVASTEATSPAGGPPQGQKRFSPPTVEEIAAYCATRANGLSPEHIHAHYTANGWKVGRNPMRDWKAAVRTWEARARAEQRERHQRQAQSPAVRLLDEARKGARQ